MSNVFSFVGIIGKNAELRYLPSGQAVLSVNVANHIGFAEKQQTLWVRVTLWGKRAESNLKLYLVKGQRVFVSGELTVSQYTKNDGTMHMQLEVNANILELAGKRDEQSSAFSPKNYDNDFPDGGNLSNTSSSKNNGLKFSVISAPYSDDENDVPF